MAKSKYGKYIVCLHGEKIDLISIADELGKIHSTVMYAWNAAGRPKDITSIEDKVLSVWPIKHRYQTWINVDGELTNVAALAKKTGRHSSTIMGIIRNKGVSLTSEDIGECQRKSKKADTLPRASRRPTRAFRVEDSSIGWAERQYFPNTGENGFCKCERDSFGGFDSKGNAVYSGAR